MSDKRPDSWDEFDSQIDSTPPPAIVEERPVEKSPATFLPDVGVTDRSKIMANPAAWSNDEAEDGVRVMRTTGGRYRGL